MKWIGASGFAHTDEVPLPLVEPWPQVTGGEFGWTLPRVDDPKRRSDLLRLLDEAGVSWVKTPLWIDPGRCAQRGTSAVVTLCEELRQRDMRLIGVLDDPPESARKAMKLPLTPTASRIFGTDPSGWMPGLEPLLTRFGLQVCFWQLGSDRDLSLATDPDVVAKVARVQQQFRPRSCLRAFAWAFLGARTCHWRRPAKSRPWRYLSLTNRRPARIRIASFLPRRRCEKRRPPELWVMLDPPAASGRSNRPVEQATGTGAADARGQNSRRARHRLLRSGQSRARAAGRRRDTGRIVPPVAHRSLGTQRRPSMLGEHAAAAQQRESYLHPRRPGRDGCLESATDSRDVLFRPRCTAGRFVGQEQQTRRCGRRTGARTGSRADVLLRSQRGRGPLARGARFGNDAVRKRVRRHAPQPRDAQKYLRHSGLRQRSRGRAGRLARLRPKVLPIKLGSRRRGSAKCRSSWLFP